MNIPLALTEETAEQTKGSIWPYATLGSLFFVAVLLVAAWNIEIPYLAYSPGPVADAIDGIEVEDVTTYRPDGDLLMLTIIGQPVNVIEAFLARLDPSIDLVKRELVRRPDETAEEYRSRVLDQMSDSNHRAVAAALDYLGYGMVPIEVIVEDFVAGVPAAAVLQRGDSIVAVDGEVVKSAADLTPMVRSRGVGDVLNITVLREGEELEVKVELVEREDTPGVPMIGILLGEITEPPFPIDINSGDIGGPSAGLMHTLAIIDVLSDGDLTNGNVIAGTGTIDPIDGAVGAIGGVKQKVVAAEAAGASYILVPADNYATALEAPRSRIQIVSVASLAEALDFLASLSPA